MNNDFEKAFGDFIDRFEYDRAETTLFDIVRTAFLSGWLAAGGEPKPPQEIFTLYFPHKTDSSDVKSPN